MRKVIRKEEQIEYIVIGIAVGLIFGFMIGLVFKEFIFVI